MSITSLATTAPASAADGSTFTEPVTVTNHGPSAAASVVSNLFVPNALSVVAAAGASIVSGTLVWVDRNVAAGSRVVHQVTFKVGGSVHATTALGGVTESSGQDPDPTNNVAIATIRLG